MADRRRVVIDGEVSVLSGAKTRVDVNNNDNITSNILTFAADTKVFRKVNSNSEK